MKYYSSGMYVRLAFPSPPTWSRIFSLLTKSLLSVMPSSKKVPRQNGGGHASKREDYSLCEPQHGGNSKIVPKNSLARKRKGKDVWRKQKKLLIITLTIRALKQRRHTGEKGKLREIVLQSFILPVLLINTIRHYRLQRQTKDRH